MKSKISCCNVVLKKDLLRFAPAMALYTVFLLLLFSIYLTKGDPYWVLYDVAGSTGLMAVVNFLYAPICAQLLFGDLFNPRMCHALHAMPLRRETWFLTHGLAGLLFSLLPNLLMALVSGAALGEFYYVALVWLAAATLQYIFFFGVSVFCVFLTGSRFAMALVYLLISFFSLFVYWMADTLILPLLYGLRLNIDGFLWFCPVTRLTGTVKYIDVRYALDPITGIRTDEILVSLGGQWWYVFLCAGLGLALLAAGLLLYRRRKLECAGDFLAFTRLEPVFLVLYSLAMGIFCHVLFTVFFGTTIQYLYLLIGLLVGYFTGRMLLKRTLRVFQLRAWLGLGALLGVTVLILAAAYFDIIGATRRVPQAAEVESVTLWPYGYKDSTYSIRLRQPEEIQSILDLHSHITADIHGYEKSLAGSGEQAVTSLTTFTNAATPQVTYPFCLEYTLHNGDTLTRYYDVQAQSEAGQLLKGYFSRPACLLGERVLDTPVFLSDLTAIRTRWKETDIEIPLDEAPQLLQAITLDCEAGSMAQLWAYHQEDTPAFYLLFEFQAPDSRMYEYAEFSVYESNTHTFAWLQEHLNSPDAAR